MMSPTVRNVSCFSLPFCKAWIAISGCCWCCSSVFISPDSLYLPAPPPPPPPLAAAATHHFRKLMNCTNLRLTSNPVFLLLQSQTITGSESCTHTLGTWELVRARTHTFTVTHSEVKLLIDRVIERFTIHLPSTVRRALLSLKFNRLRQSELSECYGEYFRTLKCKHS